MDMIGLKDFISWLASTGLLGGLLWYMQHKLQRREKERDDARDKAEKERAKALEKAAEEDRQERKRRQDELDAREEKREKYEIYLAKSVDSAVALSEATARAVQRIPDAKCNGDMHAALNYAEKVKHERKDFLTESVIQALNRDEKEVTV